MCELCGNNNDRNDGAFRTALVAKADQAVAKHADDVRAMVTFYKTLRAKGRSLPFDIGTVIMANQATYSRLELSQYLAVAISMLAEQERS